MLFFVEVAKKPNFFLNKFMIISSLKMESQKSDCQYCTDLCGFQRFIDFFSLTFLLHKGKEKARWLGKYFPRTISQLELGLKIV